MTLQTTHKVYSRHLLITVNSCARKKSTSSCLTICGGCTLIQSYLAEMSCLHGFNRKSRSSVYYDVKPIMLYESQTCECSADSNCNDDCINKMCFNEYAPGLCLCGERFENQKIQKRNWAPGIQQFMTESKGWGIKTNKFIKNGTFILEYVDR